MDIDYRVSEKIASDGFAIVEDVFSPGEIKQLLADITVAETSAPTFRKTNELFAIRQFLKEVPGTTNLIFNPTLTSLIVQLFGNGYFVVKSIYFDKPGASNWFVAYHQDLTISVDQKRDIGGYGPWTTKHNQFAVQPPIDILEDNFTIRIHLDDTNEQNGALKVIPGSHLKGIYRPETIDWSQEREQICTVKKGGIMIMKPLLLHASGRTTNNLQRRVIHIEFSNRTLAAELQWSEKSYTV